MSSPVLAAPARAEVWLARVDKLRPVVVLTRDPLGRVLDGVLVAPITSTVRGLATEVAIDAASGLRRPSVVGCDALRRVGRADLVRRVGVCDDATMRRICEAVRVAIDC